MNAFACAAAGPGTGPLSHLQTRLAARIAAPGNTATVLGADGFVAAATVEPRPLRPLLARRGALLAVGSVRLDNRAEVAAWGRGDLAGLPDLALVLAAYETRGAPCLGDLQGDFALALWDGGRGTLSAVRDPFGVRTLFLARDGGTLLLASRAAALGREGELDEEAVADFLVGGTVPPHRTVWAGVQPVGPGEVLTWRDGSIARHRFWSAASFAPAERADERQATETFRELLVEAVRVRTVDAAPVWAQLSGGLDSSSIVCVAETLARAGRGPGIAGVVTLVETMGDGDERRYSDVVVRRWGLRSETVMDPWAWQDDGLPPAPADEPRAFYPFWARDRAMVAPVRRAGGRVLLSGQGSDHYLTGSWSFITDLLAAGRVRTGLRELTRFSVAARQSFWAGLGRHGVDPFLPAWLRRRRAHAGDGLPAWLEPAFARRLEVARRLPLARQQAVPRGGSRFAHEIALGLELLPGGLERGPFQDDVEMRYPFLHRPLVEHALRLPPSLRIRPGVGKHVLREAMRGMLPEEVRTRRGKGGIDARLLWALGRERPRLDALLRDPEVSRRGWVRADALRAALERARQGEVRNLPFLVSALALETWLAVRAGRWAELFPGAGASVSA